ncbi:MAG TPA: CBS domain-containing protein [Polyangiaceae bacterium]|nr:CBS domain-containing protein [Polyangiaceae bacterium]
MRPGASRHPPPPPRLRARAAAHEVRAIELDGEPELASDVMSRELLTIGPDDPIESLEAHMESYQFRHLPVVEGKKIVGLITHSDLLNISSSMLSKSAPEENALLHRLPASRVMQQVLVTVRPTEPLANVAALIWQSRVSCVPVTEDDGTLVGIITEGDFVRLAYHFLTRSKNAH